MLPQPDGRNRHTPQMYHLRGSYPGCKATEEEHVSQAGEREACAEGKHLPRKEYQLRQVKKQAEGRGGEAMEGTLGRGQGRGKDTQVQKSTAWLETLQMTLREGPDQEESGADLEGRQAG